MESNQIEILSCKIGKTIEMSYYNKSDGYTYNVDDKSNGDVPHPDLKKALVALHVNFAAAHYVVGEERSNFIPDGFMITKAGNEEKVDQVKITGKMITSHGCKLTVPSGDIPINEKGLEDKIESLRVELWAYFFNNKTHATQGTIKGMQSAKDAKKNAAQGEVPTEPGDGE